MMSHFSVFVTVPQMNPAAPIHVDELEDRVATILARYDEQTEVDEYREFEDRTEEARADYETETMKVVQFPDGAIHSIYDRAFRDRFYLSEDSTICEYGPNHDTQSKLVTDASKALKLIPDYPVKQMYPDFDVYCDEHRGFVKNEDGCWGYTFNPNATWDWWVIGGRFPGGLLVKKELEDCIDSCKDAQAGVPDGYKFADAARKKDICWDLMKKLATEAVERSHKRCVEAWEAQKLENFGPFARITEEGIAGWGNMIYMKGETLDEYKARKGVTDADKYQVSSYAFVDRNGDWNASGDMGWFGISSNDKPERAWNDELQTLMNEVQDDDYLVAVDCHI